jgi:Natural resistance-associated macrophage protein
VKTDTKIGTAWAEVVQWAIVVVCGTVLFRHGVTHITTAAQAASALEPLAGAFAKDLFALGVVGVGLMAIPIFAGVSAYAMCELNGWRKGLDRKVNDASRPPCTRVGRPGSSRSTSPPLWESAPDRRPARRCSPISFTSVRAKKRRPLPTPRRSCTTCCAARATQRSTVRS